jgi:hypothetical protein
MILLVLALYGIIVLSYIIVYFFIIYHLYKYSINSSLNRLVMPIFVIVSTLLLLSNILLFFSIDWNMIFNQGGF